MVATIGISNGRVRSGTYPESTTVGTAIVTDHNSRGWLKNVCGRVGGT